MENTRDSCNGEMPVTNMNMTANTNCESDIHDEIISTGTKELTIDDEKAVDKGKFLGSTYTETTGGVRSSACSSYSIRLSVLYM